MTIGLFSCRHRDAERLILYRCLFRRLISEVTERMSTKLGDTFTYHCYLRNLVLSPRAFTTHGLWAKTVFWVRLRTSDRDYLCKGT